MILDFRDISPLVKIDVSCLFFSKRRKITFSRCQVNVQRVTPVYGREHQRTDLRAIYTTMRQSKMQKARRKIYRCLNIYLLKATNEKLHYGQKTIRFSFLYSSICYHRETIDFSIIYLHSFSFISFLVY